MRNQKDGGMKKEGIDQIGGMPNPELPLSQQLGQSFDKIKSQSQSIKVSKILKESVFTKIKIRRTLNYKLIKMHQNFSGFERQIGRRKKTCR